MASILIENYKVLENIIRPKQIYNLAGFHPLSAFSMDSRTIKRNEGFIALRGKFCDGHEFIQEAVSKGAGCIIAQKYIATQPKVPFLLIDDTKQALVSISRYIRDKKKPFVYGITGSIGKTTTKEMLYFLIKDYCRVLKSTQTENNLLGVAKTILSLKDQEVLISELGSNQKGEIGLLSQMLAPDVGIITFIKPVHLEGLGSLSNIFREKLSLRSANPKMKLVLNHDDTYLKKVEDRKGVYWFSLRDTSHLFARCIGRDDGSSRFLIQNRYALTLPRYQEGFIANILAAVLAAHLYGISISELVCRMRKFKAFPPMRMEFSRLGRHLILNDAYNANPYSVREGLKSLKSYPGKKIAVIADMLELGKKTVYYHQLLAGQIIKNNFDYCLTLGNCSQQLKNNLSRLGYKGAFHFKSYQDLAGFINKKIVSGQKLGQQYLIFLKGSRRMELEKVISYLKS